MSTTKSMLCLLCTTAAMAMATMSEAAQAADSYPNKPVRVILPFAPGGGTTISGRIFADRLSKEMGQNYILDNRPGGNTTIGTQVVARSTPDGYTLLITTNTLPVIQWTIPNLAFDVRKDFVGISTLIRNDEMIAVHPSVPGNNFKEFIAYAKQNPGTINARIQVGTTSHVAHVLFMQATGTKFTLVPYKGSGSALGDLLSGDLHFSMTSPVNLITYIKSGKLKGLAVAGKKRHPALPNMPTFAEAGLTNFEGATSWHMLLAPAGTPKHIVERLNAVVAKAQASKDIQDLIAGVGIDPFPNSVAATNELLRSELATIGKVVKEHNIKVE